MRKKYHAQKISHAKKNTHKKKLMKKNIRGCKNGPTSNYNISRPKRGIKPRTFPLQWEATGYQFNVEVGNIVL